MESDLFILYVYIGTPDPSGQNETRVRRFQCIGLYRLRTCAASIYFPWVKLYEFPKTANTDGDVKWVSGKLQQTPRLRRDTKFPRIGKCLKKKKKIKPQKSFAFNGKKLVLYDSVIYLREVVYVTILYITIFLKPRCITVRARV